MRRLVPQSASDRPDSTLSLLWSLWTDQCVASLDKHACGLSGQTSVWSLWTDQCVVSLDRHVCGLSGQTCYRA